MKSEQIQPALEQYERLTTIKDERIDVIKKLETQRETAGLELTKARITGIQNRLEDSITRLSEKSEKIQKEVTTHVTRRMGQVQRLLENGHITTQDFETAQAEQ